MGDKRIIETFFSYSSNTSDLEKQITAQKLRTVGSLDEVKYTQHFPRPC